MTLLLASILTEGGLRLLSKLEKDILSYEKKIPIGNDVSETLRMFTPKYYEAFC